MAGLTTTLVGLEIPDTRDLLELARAGDTEAFGKIYRAYATRLLRQAVALCGNAALAEELAEDTLVEAWKCWRRYHGRCEFFTWLCAILLNQYRNWLRKNKVCSEAALGMRRQDEPTATLEPAADRGSWPDAVAERREQTALIRQCIEALPAKHQQVIYLRFFVDDSLEGIAAALGCSVGTVKSRLFYAVDKLRGMNAIKAPCSEAQLMKGTL